MNEPTREELIKLVEDSAVPVDKWHDRDSHDAQEQLGFLWMLLHSGSKFTVLTGDDESDEDTWWVEVEVKDFETFEWGTDGMTQQFFVPTRERINKAAGKDWY